MRILLRMVIIHHYVYLKYETTVTRIREIRILNVYSNIVEKGTSNRMLLLNFK